MSPDNPPQSEGILCGQAERVFEQRSLRTLADRISDPTLRAQARSYAAGQLSAEQFVRGMHQSATAIRGFDRYMAHLASMSPEQRQAISAQRDREITQIATDLAQSKPVQAAPAMPTGRGERVRATRPDPDDEASWEDGTWLE